LLAAASRRPIFDHDPFGKTGDDLIAVVAELELEIARAMGAKVPFIRRNTVPRRQDLVHIGVSDRTTRHEIVLTAFAAVKPREHLEELSVLLGCAAGQASKASLDR
jgi:hypothetical protein